MLMAHPHPELQFLHSLPYGAVLHDRGVHFVVFSRSATAVRILLYDGVEDTEPADIIPFDPATDRWGDIWSVFIPGLREGQLYHLQADGPFDPERGQRFDGNARLVDPFAKALAGTFQPAHDGIVRPPKCVVIDDSFDWEGDRHIRSDLCRTRSFMKCTWGDLPSTPHPKSEHPGTYLGVIEKIPYLKSLGVTAVELMPVHEFPILDIHGQKPRASELLGLRSDGILRSASRLCTDTKPGSQVREFKQMVKALHAADIEVILDVVFNHTCEGKRTRPDHFVSTVWKTACTTCWATVAARYLELLGLRQYDQRQPPDRA